MFTFTIECDSIILVEDLPKAKFNDTSPFYIALGV